LAPSYAANVFKQKKEERVKEKIIENCISSSLKRISYANVQKE